MYDVDLDAIVSGLPTQGAALAFVTDLLPKLVEKLDDTGKAALQAVVDGILSSAPSDASAAGTGNTALQDTIDAASGAAAESRRLKRMDTKALVAEMVENRDGPTSWTGG